MDQKLVADTAIRKRYYFCVHNKYEYMKLHESCRPDQVMTVQRAAVTEVRRNLTFRNWF